MCLFEIKAADSFHVADEWNQLELNVDPVAPLSLAEYKFLVLHSKFCHSLQRIDGDCEGFECRRRSFAKRVVRSDQLCFTCESATWTGIICPPSTTPTAVMGS